MRNKLIGLAIVIGFVLFLGCKLGSVVSDMADSLDRTNITAIVGK